MKFTELLTGAITKAGKQESLAPILDLSPSELSKRINGQVGWTEKEINALLGYTEHEIVSQTEFSRKISALKEAMKIILSDSE